MNQPTAKRGDLIVVQTRRRAYGMASWDELGIGIVTNLTREGRIKKWRPAGGEVPATLNSSAIHRYYVIPQDQIDVEAALQTATEHTWPGGSPGMPYESLRDVQAALLPHRKPQEAQQPAAERSAEASGVALLDEASKKAWEYRSKAKAINAVQDILNAASSAESDTAFAAWFRAVGYDGPREDFAAFLTAKYRNTGDIALSLARGALLAEAEARAAS
ncbi:hypothetical protein GCM10029978_067140 [Actinoallomurus acanthiterrae]